MRSQIILCSLLLLATTGCTSPAEPTQESILSTPMAPIAIIEATREPQPLTVILHLWLPEEMDPYGQGPGAEHLAQRLVDFSTAHPDLQVDLTVKTSDGRGGMIDSLLTARDAAPSILPDLAVLDAADLETMVGAGLVQPLDPLISPGRTGDSFAFAVELGSVNGQTFGVVVGADMQQAAYRPTLFSSPPVSWTQIISSPVSFVFPAAGPDRQVNDATLIQYLAVGGRVTDSEGKPTLDEEALVSVLDFYSDCVRTATISPSDVLAIDDADQAWEQFQAGMGSITAVRAGRFWFEMAGASNVAAAPLPTRDGKPLSVARGWVIVMVTDDPARHGPAMLLLEWFTSPDHIALWTREAGYLPATESALRLWDMENAERTGLQGLMEIAVPPPRPEAMAAVGPAMQWALEMVLTGQFTPEEAAAAAVNGLSE